MTTRLPVVLESLRIAAPCTADWDQMAGDERVRFCGKCEKNVYNLSAMTRSEAETLVREKESKLCLRLYQRQDGTVLTSDCPVGVRRQRLRQRVWASVTSMTASVALMLGVLTGRARGDLAVKDGPKVAERPHLVTMGAPPALPRELMGKVAPPQPAKEPVKPPKPPKPPIAKMGEPMMPLMGDVSPDAVRTK